MDTIVISLGGSIIVPDKIDVKFLKKFAELILQRKDKRFIIVCGGGKTSRNYTDAAKKICFVKDIDLDWIGIKATKINGELLRSMFGSMAYKEVIDDPTEKIDSAKRILIGAGWKPGCSSDLDAVYLAENFEAKLIINLTNIDYVYNKDPKKYKNAKKLKDITWKEFRKIVGDKWKPGMNVPFDPIAAKKAHEDGLKLIISKGTDLKNLKDILDGKNYKGTVVK